MTPPLLEKRLLQMLPADIQFLYGLAKQAEVVIDKTAQTITIVTPNPYDVQEIKMQQQALLQYQSQYLEQIRTESADPTAQLPDNEQMIFAEALKVYEQILQRLE